MPGGWLSVGAGSEFTCALDLSQAVWCWGSGTDGRLGNGSTTRSPVPVQISGDPT